MWALRCIGRAWLAKYARFPRSWQASLELHGCTTGTWLKRLIRKPNNSKLHPVSLANEDAANQTAQKSHHLVPCSVWLRPQKPANPRAISRKVTPDRRAAVLQREISIFNPNFAGLTCSNTTFASLSKFDIVPAKCFETGVFHLFSIFPLFPLIFPFPSHPKKTYLPFALYTWIDQEGSKPSFSVLQTTDLTALFFQVDWCCFPPKNFWQHMAIIFWFRDDKLHAIYNIQITHKHCNICSIR
jgi:hypothetical protein